ncbi:two component transcriptional regulator, LytTR family [Duganella sp. CF458]|uniref:LytR/AlgR family response regulator transcription factor n=1 Tax=Duganella sp. CF458 TaxID=1884368 RepID=UPI0008E53EBA|nr:LytTR family DNA-binding domain-containing protein [Duganella sp. CF458]SFF85570.1 two component transcriptional regulator, LytTR family [Duganella sp. CF458]
MKVLIVDDEAHARTNLRFALQALAGWDVAAECASASAARAYLATGIADIVLLDVQMPRESGLEFARELSRRELPPPIIFVTAHRGHALEAFNVHALDYIVKPVDEDRLRQALERAGKLLDQRAAYTRVLRGFVDPDPGYWTELAVRSVGRIDRVSLTDVLWIESAGNYIELHLPQRTFLHRSTLTELERYLDPAQFLRIHRRILVRSGQMLAIRQLQEGSHELTLAGGVQLPVSERYAASVKARLARPTLPS